MSPISMGAVSSFCSLVLSLNLSSKSSHFNSHDHLTSWSHRRINPLKWRLTGQQFRVVSQWDNLPREHGTIVFVMDVRKYHTINVIIIIINPIGFMQSFTRLEVFYVAWNVVRLCKDWSVKSEDYEKPFCVGNRNDIARIEEINCI